MACWCAVYTDMLSVLTCLFVTFSPHGSRPGSPAPQSDSELELQRQSSAAEQTQLEAQLQAELGANGKQSWKWGELPSPPPQPMLPRHSQDVTGDLPTGEEGKLSLQCVSGST